MPTFTTSLRADREEPPADLGLCPVLPSVTLLIEFRTEYGELHRISRRGAGLGKLVATVDETERR